MKSTRPSELMSNERAIEGFAKAAASFPEAMVPSLTYIARSNGGGHNLIKARLNFHGAPAEYSPKLFVCDEIVAQRFALAEIGISAEEIIKAALGGRIITPRGECSFEPTTMGGFAATFIPLHPETLAQQTRTGVLQIRGSDQGDHWQNPLLDWSLRSADVPYDSLNELSVDFGIGSIIERSAIFEAVAPTLIVVDLSNHVTNNKASVGVFATPGLNRAEISLGYRVLDQATVVSRGSVSGVELTWTEEETKHIGRAEITVPPTSFVHCYACYQGISYHSGFIVDPSLAQNARRSAYERFDPELKNLIDLLKTKDKRRSRDLESAIASLFWMIGFNTCHLGGTKLLQDGPDIIGVTPSGHFIVIECTIGTLKADSKMPKLFSRVTALREQIAKSGNSHLRALPVMVTTMNRNEVDSEVEEAEKNGIYVITADEFPEAISRTLIPPHADQLFLEAEQSLQSLVEN